MRLEISGQHLDLTEALKDNITTKFEKLNSKYSLMNAQVVIYKEKLESFAEATIHISGNNFFAKANDKDMYVAIDKLTSKLASQLQSIKKNKY